MCRHFCGGKRRKPDAFGELELELFGGARMIVSRYLFASKRSIVTG
jgi:hypothetical protein